MNTYKVLLPLQIHTPDAAYGQGDEFETEFTADEEAANLKSGLLEIVPRDYRVIGGSRVHETDPGDTFTRALTIGEEQLLVAGGHIERVTPPKTTAKKTKEEK